MEERRFRLKGIQTEKLMCKYLVWIEGNQSCSANNLLGFQFSNQPNHFNSEEWHVGNGEGVSFFSPTAVLPKDLSSLELNFVFAYF